MRSLTISRGVTIPVEAGLVAACRWLAGEIARMVTAQLLRRLEAYERSERYYF
ncbi:MAG: hypothetical protein JO084_04860 [Bradyrhizobiaceae bacterium]|nr:hypothetical protein [Bradyrhizobiaceae bacterium]